MLTKAAINGVRTQEEHPAIPSTPTQQAIRAACPGTPVGVSTGAWIVPDVRRRLSLVGAWDVLPNFASINIHEEGALQLARLLLDRGIGVEVGIWNARAAEILLGSSLADECLRILIEPAEEPGDAIANLAEIEVVLVRVGIPRFLHGLGAVAWEFVKLAAARGYDTRTGFEDFRTDPVRKAMPSWSPRHTGSLLKWPHRDYKRQQAAFQ